MPEFALMPVELQSIDDVARLACALEKTPKPILAVRDGDEYMVGVIGEDLPGGFLVFFYHRETRVGDYLCYRFDSGREAVRYSQIAESLPTVCSPIVRFRSFPVSEYQERGGEGGPSILPVETEDVQSVAKMGLYRMALDESPGAIFFIPCGEGILGSFIRASEDEGPVLFMHHESPEPPAGFLKINPSRMDRVEFAAGPSEPGFFYLKIAKLKGCPGFLPDLLHPKKGTGLPSS